MVVGPYLRLQARTSAASSWFDSTHCPPFFSPKRSLYETKPRDPHVWATCLKGRVSGRGNFTRSCKINPLLDPATESRASLVRISTYAANAGGAFICATSCSCNYEANKEKKGCCSGCAKAKGYFNGYAGRPLKDGEFDLLAIEYGFSKKDGFWTAKGCSLPREKRSVICLSHYCYNAEKALPLIFHPNKNSPWHRCDPLRRAVDNIYNVQKKT